MPMQRPPLTFQGTPRGAPQAQPMNLPSPVSPQLAPQPPAMNAASPLPGPPMSMGGWPGPVPQMGAPQGGQLMGGMPMGQPPHMMPNNGQMQTSGMQGALSQIGLPLQRTNPYGGG